MSDDEIIQRALLILRSRMVEGEVLTSSQSVKDYLKLSIGSRPNEVFGCLFLTNQHHLIAFEELFSGTVDGSAVYPREVVRKALMHNANALIFTHNHPSGVAEPSLADMNITKRLRDACHAVDIRVLDHIVVTCGECVSMAERGMI